MKTVRILGRSFNLQSVLGWLGLVLLFSTRFIGNIWIDWTITGIAIILVGYGLWLEENKSGQ